MPVRRFHTVEELNAPVWREPGDPALYRAIARIWDFGQRSQRRRFPPGTHRRRSLDELNAATEEWAAKNFAERQPKATHS